MTSFMEAPALGMLLTIAFITAVVTLAILQFHQTEFFRISLDAQTILAENVKSDMSILSINCSFPSLDTTEAIIRNEGKQKLDLDELDVYYPDRFSRNSTSISIAVLPASDILDPGIWNPEEDINVTITTPLDPATNYTFSLVNEFGVKATASCLT